MDYRLSVDNAVAFAMNGNIVLSLEIGSAYVIQVALLQIPALVGLSAFLWGPTTEMAHQLRQPPTQQQHGFILVFPRWDFYAVMLSVFLLTYIYIEGKSNYFKGAILLLTYTVLMIAFSYEPELEGWL
jgi:Ca2+:H+ antiporter